MLHCQIQLLKLFFSILNFWFREKLETIGDVCNGVLAMHFVVTSSYIYCSILLLFLADNYTIQISIQNCYSTESLAKTTYKTANNFKFLVLIYALFPN